MAATENDVGNPANGAKLIELLRNLTSSQSKLSSDAAKEFIKILKSDAEIDVVPPQCACFVFHVYEVLLNLEAIVHSKCLMKVSRELINIYNTVK